MTTQTPPPPAGAPAPGRPVPALPEPGQVVQVRGAVWAVTDVVTQGLSRSPADDGAPRLDHTVALQSLDEDRMGEELTVVWELEVGNSVVPDRGLPEAISAEAFDAPDTLGAFVDAVRWGAVTSADPRAFQSPFRSGATLSQALVVVPAPRRQRARELMSAGGLGPQDRERTVAVLSAVAGAAARLREVRPVWTAPAGMVGAGALTGDGAALIRGANTSVVCATYNLQPTSALWAALVDLRQRRPGVAVRLYVDAQAADGPFKGRGGASRVGGVGGRGGTGVRGPTATSRRAPGLSTGEMARRLRGAVVMRTRAPEDGMRAVTSHAKLLSIDHRFLLVGSANLSYSAEERNVELGLRLDDPALAHGVEKQLQDLEGVVYKRVSG